MMTAATTFTLVLLTLAATASMTRALGGGASGGGTPLASWLALYVVAVVAPWAWALSRARARVADADCAAPVVTGCVALVAAGRLVRPGADWLPVVGVLVVAAALLIWRLVRPGPPRSGGGT